MESDTTRTHNGTNINNVGKTNLYNIFLLGAAVGWGWTQSWVASQLTPHGHMESNRIIFLSTLLFSSHYLAVIFFSFADALLLFRLKPKFSRNQCVFGGRLLFALHWMRAWFHKKKFLCCWPVTLYQILKYIRCIRWNRVQLITFKHSRFYGLLFL